MDLCFFLIGTFLFKGFFHEVHHRNSADTSLRFGRVAVEVATLLAAVVLTVVVVDQRVVDGDRPFLKIHIAPAQPSRFSYTQACTKHHSKDRVPVLVLWRLGEVGQQKILLCNGQCLAAIGLKLVGFFQFFQNVVRWIAPQITVIHRHVQHLMQNRVYAVNRRDLQTPLVCQRVVELLHIRLFERRHLRFAEIRLHELPIKVQIVLESVVLQATLHLCPQGEHIVQGDIPRFCLDAFQ